MTAYQNRRAYRTGLSDEKRATVQSLLAPATRRGRPRVLGLSEDIKALVYVVGGGIQWRSWPQDYRAWPSVYYSFPRLAPYGKMAATSRCPTC